MKTIRFLMQKLFSYSDEILLVLALFYKFYMMWNKIDHNAFTIAWQVIVGLLIVINFLIKHYNNSKKIPLILIVVLSITMYALFWDYDYGTIALASINFIDKGARQFVRCFGITVLAFLSISIVGSLNHLIPLFETVKNGRTVYDFGLEGLINTPGMLYMAGMIAVVSTDKKIISRVLGLIGAILIYIYTASRSSFLASIIFLALDFTRVINLKSKPVKLLLVLSVPLFLCFSIFVANNYDKVEWLNGWLTGRPDLWKMTIENYKVLTLRGSVINHPIDNWYIDQIYRHGIATFIIYGISYTLAMGISIKSRSYSLACAIFTILVYGLTEAQNDNMLVNFALGIVVIKYVSSKKDIYLLNDFKYIPYGVMDFIEGVDLI